MSDLLTPWAVARVFLGVGLLALPGLALSRRLLPASTGPARLAIGGALALAIHLLLALVFLPASHGVYVLVVGVLSLGALPVALRGWRRDRAWRLPLVAAAAFFAGGVLSTRPITVWSDAVDHVATVRAIRTTGELEPNHVFYADGDGDTPDIRKGFYHVTLAALARLSGLSAIDTWYALRPIALALGGFTFAVFATAFLSPLAAGIGVVLSPFLLHGNAAWFLDTFLYPHNADWVLLWSALLMVLGLVRNGNERSSWALALLAAALPCMHVFAPVLLWTGTGAIALGTIAFGHREAFRRALRALGVGMVASLPVLLLRLARGHHPVNPLHIEHSEVFYLTRHLTVHPPEPLFAMFSLPAVSIAFASVLWLGRGARASRSRAALVGLAWVPLLITFNPVAGAILQPVIKYLFIRFLGLVPFPLIAAVALSDAIRERRPWRLGIALVVAALVVLQMPRTFALASGGAVRADRAVSPETWRAAYDLVTATVGPDTQTVLTDPMTGYALPAYSPHHVVAVLDQHSSPSDSTILFRLDDVARALSPYRPIGEALDVLARRDARYVLVNGAVTRVMESHFDVRRPDMTAATIARFDRQPDVFDRVGEAAGCVLYRWNGRVPAHPEPPLSPPRENWTNPDSVWLNPVVSLIGIDVWPRVARPGDTLHVRVGLRKDAPDEPADAYRIVLRGRRDLAESNVFAHRFERLYARAIGATGRSLEFVSNRRPLDGRYPIRLWDVTDTAVDTFSVPLPRDLEPGPYRVGVSLHRQQLVRNIALRDWLRPTGGIGVHVLDIDVRVDGDELPSTNP